MKVFIALCWIVGMTAAAPARSDSPAAAKPAAVELGGDVGVIAPFYGGPVPFRIGGLAVFEVAPLSPQLRLAVTGQVALAIAGTSQSYSGPFGSVSSSTSSVAIEMLATARLHGNPQPWLGLYADAGLGVVPIFAGASTNVSGTITSSNSNAVAGMFRLAGGADFLAAPRLKIFVEPIGFHVYFANASTAGYTLLVGVRYAL